MPRSTGSFIPYDLRPAKQTERRILLDVLGAGVDNGLHLADYRYVGMGANRFYDFVLIHKYLGISNMVSLEHDDDFYPRAAFNKPYAFIDVQNINFASFISTDATLLNTIYWLDYDGGIGGPIVRDIAALGARLKVGDFCFVTVYGKPPRMIDNMNNAGRLARLQEILGPVAGTLALQDMQTSRFATAVHKILLAAFTNSFATRTDGKFYPLLQVSYSDTVPMVTVGGALLEPNQIQGYRSRLKTRLPFLHRRKNALYDIASLHLTERERHLFDRAVTSSTKRVSDWRTLKAIGFDDTDYKDYRDLVRFLPRYVEAVV